MNQTLWNGIGQINDNLIVSAEKETVRAYFHRQKQILWVKYGSLAACLCLVICLCVPIIRTIQDAEEGAKYAETDTPESVLNDKSVKTFADLNFTYINAYSDNDGNEILLFDIRINRWIKNAEGYVKQLYIRSESDGLIGISAFGRELLTEQIDGKEFFMLDTTEENSVYNLDLYLSFRYLPGGLIQYKSYDDTNNLTVYLNGTDESCRGEIKFCFNGQTDAKPVILKDIEALRELTDAILPTVFPTKATPVNQILWYPEIGYFDVSYKTDNVYESYTVTRGNSETVYGGQKKETYFYNGTKYTIITDEAGYEYPPFNIDFEDSGYYYSIRVDVRQQVDVCELIHGLSAD